MDGLNSDLNLNSGVPPRAMPIIGEWGPLGVVSTKQKRRQRWLVLGAAFVVLVAICLLGWWVWTIVS